MVGERKRKREIENARNAFHKEKKLFKEDDSDDLTLNYRSRRLVLALLQDEQYEAALKVMDESLQMNGYNTFMWDFAPFVLIALGRPRLAIAYIQFNQEEKYTQEVFDFDIDESDCPSLDSEELRDGYVGGFMCLFAIALLKINHYVDVCTSDTRKQMHYWLRKIETENKNALPALLDSAALLAQKERPYFKPFDNSDLKSTIFAIEKIWRRFPEAMKIIERRVGENRAYDASIPSYIIF